MIDLLKYRNGAFTFLIKIREREREREKLKTKNCKSSFLNFVLPMYLYFFGSLISDTKRCKFELYNFNSSLGHFDIDNYIRIIRSRERTLKANNRTTSVFWPTI